MALPASMGLTTWNTLTTNVLPKWYNGNKARDIVSRATPTLFWLMQNAKREELPERIAMRLLDTLDLPEAFEYYDTVSTAPSRTTTAAEETVSQYSVPIAISDQEKLEHMTKEAIANRMEQMVWKAERGYAKRLAIDIFAGSQVNSKRIRGLEQICYPTTQSGGAGAISLDTWKARQAANTYANVARAAYTAEDTTGTGWENVSVNWNNTQIQMATSAPYTLLDTGYKLLLDLFNLCTYGTDRPDLIVMSPQAYDDYENTNLGKTTVYKMADSFGGADLSFSGMSFKGVPLIRDEFCKSYVTVSNATANDNCIYMLKSSALQLLIDPREDFALSEPKMPYNQFASSRFIKFRGQLLSESPRELGVGFNYYTA